GELEKIDRACELAKARGAKKAVPLPVAGAYHSTLMTSAQPKLRAALAAVRFQSPTVPVISNVTSRPHGSVSEIPALLVEQITASVRWEESMRYLLAQGFTRFIELIDRNAQIFNVADVPSLEATVKEVGGERNT